MQEVFEKIIERLEKNKESFKDAREKTFCRVTETDDCDSCKADHYLDARLETINSAIEIVKQTAEQYNDGWIPCSERLPEESGTYNITAFDGGKYRTTNAMWQKRSESWNLKGRRAHWSVIAWQPLPAPYKPKGE